MATSIKVTGVGRDAMNGRSLDVSFNRVPSDDELRQFHEHCRAWGPTSIEACEHHDFTNNRTNFFCARCGQDMGPIDDEIPY